MVYQVRDYHLQLVHPLQVLQVAHQVRPLLVEQFTVQVVYPHVQAEKVMFVKVGHRVVHQLMEKQDV